MPPSPPFSSSRSPASQPARAATPGEDELCAEGVKTLLVALTAAPAPERQVALLLPLLPVLTRAMAATAPGGAPRAAVRAVAGQAVMHIARAHAQVFKGAVQALDADARAQLQAAMQTAMQAQAATPPAAGRGGAAGVSGASPKPGLKLDMGKYKK